MCVAGDRVFDDVLCRGMLRHRIGEVPWIRTVRMVRQVRVGLGAVRWARAYVDAMNLALLSSYLTTVWQLVLGCI